MTLREMLNGMRRRLGMRRSVGLPQAVFVIADRHTSSGPMIGHADVEDAVRQLGASVERLGIGELDDHELTEVEIRLYFFADDAEAFIEAVRPELGRIPWLKGARLRMTRHGLWREQSL